MPSAVRVDDNWLCVAACQQVPNMPSFLAGPAAVVSAPDKADVHSQAPVLATAFQAHKSPVGHSCPLRILGITVHTDLHKFRARWGQLFQPQSHAGMEGSYISLCFLAWPEVPEALSEPLGSP